MAHEAVKILVGHEKENQLVLFGGTSAGGRGSMVTIDALRLICPKLLTDKNILNVCSLN